MKIFLSFSIFFAFVTTSIYSAQIPNRQPNSSPNSNYPLHGEIDKTDTYAVPLDMDEEEENEEINSLDQRGQKAEQRWKKRNI